MFEAAAGKHGVVKSQSLEADFADVETVVGVAAGAGAVVAAVDDDDDVVVEDGVVVGS